MIKQTYSDIAASINDFADLSYKDKGSFSYACGTFQSMLATLVADLPKHKQAEFLKTLEHAKDRTGRLE
jgi:hypothetical protein